MRKMIKNNAKEALRFRYWLIVGVELIAGALVGGVSSISANFGSKDADEWKQMFESSELFREIFLAALGIAAIASVAGLLYTFLFGNVIQVGISGIRLKAYRKQNFKIVDLFSGLKA